MARAATVKGTFLVPGVSKNGRLYHQKNIASAVSRMKEALQSPDGLPLTMYTSHGEAAADNALSTIGMITNVDQLPDGSATFEADIADTAAGRDIAALVVPDSQGRRFVKGISIRGQWMSDPQEVTTESGDTVITADELGVAGIDFTSRPGVGGAQITDAALAESVAAMEEALKDKTVIFESAPDAEFVDETAKPTPGSNYADPGYQKDGKKRYPLDTAKHVRAAWSYINAESNSKFYSANQLKRIKSKIKSAAGKFGIDIQSESQMLVDELTEVLEAYASMCIDNGGGSVSVSGYTDDAGKLVAVAQRIAMSAIAGLNTLDPDADGDIDIMVNGKKDSSMETAPDDDEMEGAAVPNCTHCGEPVEDTAMYCPMCGQPIQQAESTDLPTETENQEGIVPADETTTTDAAAEAPVAEAAAEATAPAAPVVDTAAIAAGVAEALAPSFAALIDALKPAPVEAAAPAAPAPAVEAAPVAPAAPEAPAPAALTEEEIQARVDARAQELADQKINEAVAEFRKTGGIRKGLVPTRTAAHTAADLSETDLSPKALAEMSNQDFLRVSGDVWETQPYAFAQGKSRTAVGV